MAKSNAQKIEQPATEPAQISQLLAELDELLPKNAVDVAVMQRYDPKSVVPRFLEMREKFNTLRELLATK